MSCLLLYQTGEKRLAQREEESLRQGYPQEMWLDGEKRGLRLADEKKNCWGASQTRDVEETIWELDRKDILADEFDLDGEGKIIYGTTEVSSVNRMRECY